MTASRRNAASEPGNAGYSMPAEWGPHQCTWISWPHNEDTWPGKLAAAERVMVKLVEVLSQGELVRINVQHAAHEKHVQALLDAHSCGSNVRFHRFPTNDAWCRDHGALFVQSSTNGQLLALDFGFNAWGEKYLPYDLDDAIAGQMAAALDVPCRRVPMILEGGVDRRQWSGRVINDPRVLAASESESVTFLDRDTRPSARESRYRSSYLVGSRNRWRRHRWAHR